MGVGLSPEDDFRECDTCRAKPGMPVLCSGCFVNRTLISSLKQKLAEAVKEKEQVQRNGNAYRELAKSLSKILFGET